MRFGPCAGSRPAGAPGCYPVRQCVIRHLRDPEAEQPLGLLDAALQVADGVHLAQVDADGDERLGDLRGQAR